MVIFIAGTLEPLVRKEIIRKKPRQRDAQVPTKRPENVQAVSKVEDGVEETVQKIKALVSHYYKINTGPLDFFKLILNPDNFGRTVENMLHVSFLVRDGYFSLVKGCNIVCSIDTFNRFFLFLFIYFLFVFFIHRR